MPLAVRQGVFAAQKRHRFRLPGDQNASQQNRMLIFVIAYDGVNKKLIGGWTEYQKASVVYKHAKNWISSPSFAPDRPPRYRQPFGVPFRCRRHRREVLRKIPFALNSDEWHFDTEILIQFHEAGLRIAERLIPTYYGDEIC